ncbi:MAG: ABC transporter ATP-binding protein [Gammaproteobacteria bacterium]|nr:ABC transporter ATP-binding protein [Gammaproteobacteria bacterium]
MTALLQTRGLEVAIAGKCICRGFDLAIERGQCWGMLGRNGIGKTTLLHTLAGLRAPLAGATLLEGVTLDTLPRRRIAQSIGVLFQHSEDPFPGTVLETVLIGRHPYLAAWQWEGAEDRRRAQQALAAVGMEEMMDRQVATLSGGERQRLAIATLLIQEPRLMLLDEPANHLDLHHQIAILDLLAGQVRDEGRALLMIGHDLNLTARYCDHALLLFGEGETLCGEVAEVLTESHLERLYGHPIRCAEVKGRRVFVAG